MYFSRLVGTSTGTITAVSLGAGFSTQIEISSIIIDIRDDEASLRRILARQTLLKQVYFMLTNRCQLLSKYQFKQERTK